MYAPDEVHVIDDLATLKLISDPLRQRILEAARGQARSVKEIAEELGLPATKLYYHVRLLEERGLLVVVETRIVSGIVERRFQTTAPRFGVDRRVLNGEDASGLEHIALALVLDEARADLQHSISAGLIDPASEQLTSGGFILGRTWRRWSPQQADEFFRRFKQLEDEISAATEGDDRGTEHEYEILLGVFPRVPTPGDLPTDQ